MKTLHYLSSPFLLCLLGLIPCIAFAQAAVAPKRSPELQVLDHFIGSWDITNTFKPVGGEKIVFSIVSRKSWSPGGSFLRGQDTNLSIPEAKEFHLLWTYDPVAKNYPAVFMEGPNRGELTGVWDAKKKTMHWKVKMANGITGEGHDRFIGKDRIESSGIFKNDKGETVFEISWSRTRRKAKSPTK
jgi:hypothetical protein